MVYEEKMSTSNPMTPSMKGDQLNKFLARPVLMDLATITPEGYPHVAPVWFEYGGDSFLISTTRERKKAKNLSVNPRAGFSIAEHSLPYAAVVGYGDVEVEDDPKGILLLRLARKYLPIEKAERYWRELMKAGGSRIIIKIKPTWILSWTGE